MDDHKDDGKKKAAHKPLLPEEYIEGDKKIENKEVSPADLRLFGYSWGGISSIRASMKLLASNRALAKGKKSIVEGYEVNCRIRVKWHLVVDPVLTGSTPNSTLEVGDNTDRFINYYQRRLGKAIIRNAKGEEIARETGGLLGNNVRGSKIKNVTASMSLQVGVDTDVNYRDYKMPFVTKDYSGSLSNKDANHSFMPEIMRLNNFIKW